MRTRLMLWGMTSLIAISLSNCKKTDRGHQDAGEGNLNLPALDPKLVDQGKEIFRYETFGDETTWTDVLKMNQVIEAAVDPVTALSVGLKVDASALPPEVVAGIQNGSISLTDPQTTLALLQLNAVVGIKGQVSTTSAGKLKLDRVGITCALCHSTVDNSFAMGIGGRLDGYPNRDLDPGAIISLSPSLTAAQKAVYASWGKGKFDPRYNHDGLNNPVVIPPAFGLYGLPKAIFTGDGDVQHESVGPVAYWNRYVAVTEMGAHGKFSDTRTGLNVDNTGGGPDLVTDKLPALQAYQFSLAAPQAQAGSFDATAAARGKILFNNKAQCATCHSGPKFTDVTDGGKLHPQDASVANDKDYVNRSATKQWRVTPLKGIWQHAPYFHDGSAATLSAVVDKYNASRNLGLTSQEKTDLTEYLKSL
ncbi:MAG: c-type cytochrome [Sphingobacteriales bacterium]|nr:c-type cytochrome [Sphingobacteriales bacterium]